MHTAQEYDFLSYDVILKDIVTYVYFVCSLKLPFLFGAADGFTWWSLSIAVFWMLLHVRKIKLYLHTGVFLSSSVAQHPKDCNRHSLSYIESFFIATLGGL
jgi:hypothetical protein